MRGFRSIVSIALALTLVAGAAVHGARAAGMAMPMAMTWSAEAAEPCDLCGGSAAEAAGQCALVCAGLTGVVSEPPAVPDHLGESPTAVASAANPGRFAGPEPDPPR